MEVVTATARDIDLLIEFRFYYLYSQGDISDTEREQIEKQLREYFAEHLGRDCECFLLKKDGEYISSVYMIKLDRPAGTTFPNGKTAFLMNVFTKPEYRKTGAASVLLDFVIEYAKSCKISAIDLSSTKMGRSLYLRKGFCLRGNSEMRMSL
ncbi:MAG: GNAT family N-acetyltransferase [Ruminococcus sp.]|jgi:GNAT superfamily N-acetyltransferase|nr:GNAT family N-acetyltransferase [Ruminococcus sp.]